MKIEFGPTPDGKHYFFPADAIATKTMRREGENGEMVSLFPTRLRSPLATAGTEVEDTKRTYRRENNDKGFATSFYALDYETPAEKLAVRQLVETWKQHFNVEHPYAFTGEYMDQKYRPFFDKMGATYVFGPDKMVIREFADNKKSQDAGHAPAAERFAVARELLEEDIHNFDPNSVSVRNELTKLGGVFVKRGEVTGWVIPPGGNLDPEAWGRDKDRADQLIESARTIAPGEYKNLVDLQISYIIDLGLDEQAFGRKVTKLSEAHELGAFELRAGLRTARTLYANMVAENDRVLGENPAAQPPHELLMDENGRPLRSLVTAAARELGKKNPEITLESVVTNAVTNASKSFESATGIAKQDEDRAKGPRGAYATAEPLKALAKQIANPEENIAAVVSRLEAIQEALPEGATLTPMKAIQPYVAIGPVVAISENYIVQQQTGMREGVEYVEYYVHDRSRFIAENYTNETIAKESASVGHVLTDRTLSAEKWEATIKRGNPIAVGTHAGVLVGMSLQRMEEINPTFASAGPGTQQTMLVEQMTKEVGLARYEGITKAIGAHKNALGFHEKPTLATVGGSLPDLVLQIAATNDFNAKRETELASEREATVTKAKERLDVVHEAMIERAKNAHAATPFADSRSTAAMNRGSARIPAPVRESQLPVEPKLVLGQIYDAAYDLKNLIVVQPVARQGKGDDQTFTPIPGQFYLYNTNDSIDMFAHRNSEGRIARSYHEKKAVIALGFSEGHLVVKKDQGRPVGQIDIDNAMGYFKEKAVEQMAFDKEFRAKRQAETEKYAGFEPGSLESERREWLDGVLSTVKHVVANERNISIGKIMVERQDQNTRFSEEQAFSESGIYVKKADVRNGTVRSVPSDMSIVDLGAVKWMVADVKAIERDVVVVHAYDKENNVSRIYPLPDFAGRDLPVKNSELASGVPVSRTLQKNDLVEFAKTGLDEDGYPEYRVSIIDRELQLGLDAQARKEEAKRRVDAFFPQRVELDKTQTTKESKAALETLREVGFKPRQINVVDHSADGHYMGIVYPVQSGEDRFVALVTNADSYQKQNGEMNIRVIRDQDTVDRVFAKRNHDGIQPEAGGLASIVFRDGKVAVFEVRTKEELKLSANALEEIERLRALGESAEAELSADGSGHGTGEEEEVIHSGGR
jgi:hypothetical protein